MRLLLPDGMTAGEVRFALRSYANTRLVELERAAQAFCGWDARHDDRHEAAAFVADAVRHLTLDGAPPPALTACSHFHGGAGETLRSTNLGAAAAGEVHNVTARFDQLPASVRALPRGSDLLVTFATGSVAIMALNWAANARQAGVRDVLIGALDDTMMRACRSSAPPVPCVLVDGGEVSRELMAGMSQNLRSRPSLYPKMSVLKVGFYRELLTFGYNVWACDADAVFVHDPRPLMAEPEWREAELAAATDCIDVHRDSQYPLLHCDLNTGMVYMRASAATIAFTERWRETIATAKEVRIRDQMAFNMLLKQRRLTRYAGRLFYAANGPQTIKLGVLPLNRFLNGHTYFVQHAHTLRGAPPPLAVHMTYQFAEGSKFAHGKRQRLRQAGLWHVDDDAYYNGRYVMVSAKTANLPVRQLPPTVSSVEAIDLHLLEGRHRSRVLHSLLGIAKVPRSTAHAPRTHRACTAQHRAAPCTHRRLPWRGARTTSST